MKEYLDSWKRAFDFSGRSRRREFWIPLIINILIYCIMLCLLSATEAFSTRSSSSGDIIFKIFWVYYLLYIIPLLSLIIRRLHDMGKSGWWYFISLIPLVGTILLIIYLSTDSVSYDNEYGISPKYSASLL